MAYNVQLSWIPTNGNRADAKVYRNAAGQGFQALASVGIDATYTDGPFGPAEQLSYYVTEVVGGLESAPSNEVSVTTPPVPPTGLTATVVSA